MKGVIDVFELQDQRLKTRTLIDYSKECDPFTGARFIFECGIKLNAHFTTITTAAYIYHKFFENTSFKNYDVYLVGSACLLMAGKIKEDLIRIRDIINVSYATLFRNAVPLDLGDRYWSMRDAIIQCELLVMRMVKFAVNFEDPHKYLLQYYKSLKGWLQPQDWKECPLIQMALAYLNDYHHDSSIVKYKPSHVAIACLFLSVQCYGVVIPNTSEDDGLSWFSVFDPELTKDVVWEISERIMDTYERNT